MSNIDSLNYLGTFDVIGEVYAVYPSGGVPGNFVIVGGQVLYWNQDLMRWTAQDGSTGDDSTVNGTLSVNDLVLRDGFRTSDWQEDVQGSALRKKNGQWVLSVDDIRVANGDRFRGQASFRMQVFTRSESKPAAPNGGQYSDPMPNGVLWQEGVPQGSNPIWMSWRIYTSDGQSPQNDWSDPLMLVDSETFDVEFSPHTAESVPAAPSPSNKGTLWFDPKEHPNADWSAMNWMAMRTKSVNIHGEATWDSWVILPTHGAKGADGDGYENVYYRTALKVVPIPSITTNSTMYQMAGYCPGVSNKSQCGGTGNSFTASPKGVSESLPYEWVMQRRKVGGTWMQFSMPPVLFATFSREHTITISERGFWVIDGIETDKRAIGENGTAATIKGRVDVYAEEEKTGPSQTSLETYPTSLQGDSAIEVGDCWVVESGEDGDGNDVSGHLFLYVGGNNTDWYRDWQDIGEFKGDKGEPGTDGHSQYLYLAWATEVHFTGNPQVFDNCVGYTTDPAEGQNYPWMGIMVSETEISDIDDDENAPDFKWNYLPGRDGKDYENVYIRTKTLDAPEISLNEVNKNGYQTHEFLPAVDNISDYTYVQGGSNNTIESNQFFDDPNGVSEEWPYEWQSRRERINGVWQAFQSPAVLHRNWAKGVKGDDGEGQLYVDTGGVDRVVIDCDANGHPKAQDTIDIEAKLYIGTTRCGAANSQGGQSSSASVVVDCTGFAAVGSTKCTYIVSDNNGYSVNIRLNIKTAATIASGTIMFTLRGGDADGNPVSANKVVNIVANLPGAKGEKGDSGPVLRFRGEYSSTVDQSGDGYVWDDNFRDCVKSGSTYYLVNVSTNGGTPLGTPPNNKWMSAGGNLKFFATELLLAENGAINLLSSNVINLFNANGGLVARLNDNGEGSYCIYYPGTTKKLYEIIPGWQIYYDNDADNTELWRLGKSGVIIRTGSVVTMSKIRLSENPIAQVGDLIQYDPNLNVNVVDRYIFSNEDSTHNNEVYMTGAISNNEPAPGNNVVPNGIYAQASSWGDEIDKDNDDTHYHILPLVRISNGRIAKIWTERVEFELGD